LEIYPKVSKGKNGLERINPDKLKKSLLFIANLQISMKNYISKKNKLPN
jgi:hypothetical protein